MLKKIMLAMVCICAIAATPSKAGDLVFGPYKPLLLFDIGSAPYYGPYRPAENVFERKTLLYQSGQELSFLFAGQKEVGALSLFVAADSFSVEENDLYLEGLNAISPAAGVQFSMDFKL